MDSELKEIQFKKYVFNEVYQEIFFTLQKKFFIDGYVGCMRKYLPERTGTIEKLEQEAERLATEVNTWGDNFFANKLRQTLKTVDLFTSNCCNCRFYDIYRRLLNGEITWWGYSTPQPCQTCRWYLWDEIKHSDNFVLKEKEDK